MTFGRGPIATFLALLLLLLLGRVQPAAAAQPSAVQGRLVLPAHITEPLPLQGQWGFAWQRFVDPHWEQLPTAAFAHVPASWNDLEAGGKTPGPKGWGSYVLLVDCPKGEALAVEAIGQRTAARLFVNGEEVAAHGRPGPTAAQNWAAVYNRVPISREFACPLRLTLHLANYDHRAGGFVRPMNIGPADALEHARETRMVYEAALLAAYVLTGVVGVIFYLARRRERVPLVYGLFCLMMACYTDLIGERLLLRPLPPQVSWLQYMRAEYLSWIGAMVLFFLTLRGLFPNEIHRRATQVVLALLGLGAVATLLLPPGIYSYVAWPGQAIAVVVGAYVAIALMRADAASRPDAQVLLAGMIAIIATLVMDLLLIDVPGPDRKFSPLGFAIFMLSPAVVIARRMSRALNAEERGRTLEENARLREDVERISRHDLKTPLNSILGATRLLRDDPQLSGEQRELVEVQQRAALRMLEMVNLSLGLFRMETGSYDFRPQPVDLRETVSRVLVDLHSYAEAAGVALHWAGSGADPVYVRGEQLLCYSIVANVVKNAIEAAGPGQRVAIAMQPGEPVVLTVHNPGEVPPEIAARFFEKYVTRGKSGGTGLGTYSARLMARAQHGELAMRTGSTGTTLTLTLAPLQGEPPLRQAAAAAEDLSSSWVEDMPAREVLLVDDDEFTRLVNRRLLPSPPFRVATAANGQAAEEAMAQRWPDYLLIDMEMPVKSGVETVRWVRAQEADGRRRCHVVMLSGNDDEASAARARDAGADRFLVKPVSRERLLATLHELEAALPAEEAAAHGAALAESGPADEVLAVDPEWVEVFPNFVQLQRGTVDAMASALAAGDRADLQFLAHRAHGGLATMGLHWAAWQSRILERDALKAPAEELGRRIEALHEHLGKVRVEAR